MTKLLGLLGGGNPLRAYVTGGILVALLLTGLFAWLLLGRVSDRDEKIGLLRGEVTRVADQRDDAIRVAQGNADALVEEQRLRRLSDAAVDLLMQRQQRAAPVIPKIAKEANRVAQANPLPAACPAVDPVWDAVADGLRRYRADLGGAAGKD